VYCGAAIQKKDKMTCKVTGDLPIVKSRTTLKQADTRASAAVITLLLI